MIEIKNINKTYGAGESRVMALKNINLLFGNNEFVSILGQSGCGKTTLLNILGGLDRYDSGDICINGKSTKNYSGSDWDTYRNHYIGFVFQSYNLIPHLSVLENVELALSLGGMDKKRKRIKAVNALKMVGLENQLRKRPNQLSGGQMQRVAIARAIVNDPEIILADEPTGALDSETSIQIMDILKEISQSHLVIMVTHNKELAERYSSRIINLHDGKVVNDSKKVQVECGEKKPEKKKKSSMSLITAFSLSFKNLLAKWGKSLLVSVAGSIGIIGIALVLSVSNGFTNYINKVQSEALGNYPITVSAITMDMNSFMSINNEEKTEINEETTIIPYNPLLKYVQYGHYNNLTSEFVKKVNNLELQDGATGNKSFNLIDYNYFVPVKLITKDSSNTYKFVKRRNAISILSNDASSSLYPMLDNTKFVMEQYDLIYGNYPQKSENDLFTSDLLLVVDSGNKIAYSTLEEVGIKVEKNSLGEYEDINFEDIIGKEYKLITNDQYYVPNANNFDNITSFSKIDTTNNDILEESYQNSQTTLKISGIIRPKKNATSTMLSTGLVYMRDLENFYMNDCKNSVIAQKERENIANGNFDIYDPYYIEVAELSMLPPFSSVQSISNFLMNQYGYTLPDEEIFEIAMQQIGISNMPINIKFYPKNFAAKETVVKMIEEYNKDRPSEGSKIVYSDNSQFLTNTLGQLVNIISYVLIAFASISLIVSSVMIGIITYSSVIERTKEIGVLRSLGARKRDISRVFNMETFIIGLSAGVIGVLITFILTFPISTIIKSVSKGSVVTNLAILRFDHMIILILISVILTIVAGLVPARIASKKDPVKALRAE